MDKIDKNSMDIIEDKIEFIKKTFPEVVVAGKIEIVNCLHNYCI